MMCLLGASGYGVACPNRRQKIFFVIWGFFACAIPLVFSKM